MAVKLCTWDEGMGVKENVSNAFAFCFLLLHQKIGSVKQQTLAPDEKERKGKV